MKDIKNYEGLYAATEDGRIWSYKNNKFLKPGRSKAYLSVALHKNGQKKTVNIHRLVAETFIPNPDGLPCINHIDEDKLNNSIDNLEWCTVKYNTNYGTSIQRAREKQKKAIYCQELDKIFSSVSDAAALLDLGRENIKHALKGRTETAYGYHWRYV